jgi:hypothetical protein
MALLHVCMPGLAPLTNFVYVFCIYQKSRNVDMIFLMYQCKMGQTLLQPKILVRFFNNIYPNWENSDNKQRSQKTFAYGDTFA